MFRCADSMNRVRKAAAVVVLLWLGAAYVHRVHTDSCFQRSGPCPDAAPFTVGKGPVGVLLIHGFTDKPRVFDSFARLLAADTNLTVRAMRLPSVMDGDSVSSDGWMEAVRGELAELRRSHRTVWLAGHSLGGTLALLTATREKVDGVVLLAPLVEPAGNGRFLTPLRQYLLVRGALPFTRVFPVRGELDRAPAGEENLRYRKELFVSAEAYQALFETTGRLKELSSFPPVPVLCFSATRDAVVDTAAAEDWMRRCCPAGKIIRLEEGHLLPLGTGRSGIAAEVVRFIENTP